MRKANIFISFCLIAFTGFYAVLIIRLPDRNLPQTLGAAFMPWVLAGSLMTLSVLLLINNIFNNNEQDKIPIPLHLKDLAGIAGLLALVTLYIAGMNFLGFFIASVLFMAALIFFSGSKKPLEIAVFSIFTSIAVYLLFRKFFNVQLPEGIIF